MSLQHQMFLETGILLAARLCFILRKEVTHVMDAFFYLAYYDLEPFNDKSF